jgi:hypothetical protein
MRVLSSMVRALGPAVLVLCLAQSGALAQRSQISSAEAQRLEATLKSNPHDRAARSALLGYYFLGRLDPAVAVPARRRHILWLIENIPDDPLAGSPSATIDAAGHSLADPQGFKLASEAWRAQTSRPGASAAALTNAAYFFKLSDKPLTISLLERAIALDSSSKETAARLGDEYALAIMGVTMVNKNGYPVGANASLTKSAVALRAREALTTSRNPYVLAKAGYMLMWQGSVLYHSGKLSFDTAPIATHAMDRAVSLAPGEQDVASYRDQVYAMQREMQGRVKSSPASVGATPSEPQSVQAANPVPAVPAKAVTADALREIKAGMSREQLLKLGSPAGRLTMNEDSHLIEIYRYSAGGKSLGTVRLTDGTVSSVQLP